MFSVDYFRFLMLLFQKFSRCDRRNRGTGKIFDIPCENIVCTVPLRHSVYNGIFKVGHRAHECGMNIYTLYISKCDKLRKLFNPILCLLSGLKRFAEYIENICGSRCGEASAIVV